MAAIEEQYAIPRDGLLSPSMTRINESTINKLIKSLWQKTM